MDLLPSQLIGVINNNQRLPLLLKRRSLGVQEKCQRDYLINDDFDDFPVFVTFLNNFRLQIVIYLTRTYHILQKKMKPVTYICDKKFVFCIHLVFHVKVHMTLHGLRHKCLASLLTMFLQLRQPAITNFSVTLKK